MVNDVMMNVVMLNAVAPYLGSNACPSSYLEIKKNLLDFIIDNIYTNII
jgi:hypothetical protein